MSKTKQAASEAQPAATDVNTVMVEVQREAIRRKEGRGLGDGPRTDGPDTDGRRPPPLGARHRREGGGDEAITENLRRAGVFNEYRRQLAGALNRFPINRLGILKRVTLAISALFSYRQWAVNIALIDAIAENQALRKELQRESAFVVALVRSMDTRVHSLNNALSSLRTELRTELGGRLKALEKSPLADEVTRLKRDVVLQDRRVGLLLEEARKRLPEPMDHDQVSVFADADRHRLDALYVSLEDEFRGSRDDIKERLRVYLPTLGLCNAGQTERPIVDIGCGRGEWLELLRSVHLQSKGVDSNEIMVSECQELGLDVIQGDAMAYLRSLPDGHLGAVTGFHLIEHIPFNGVIKLFDESLRVLAPGGVIIFETPNPDNVLVGSRNFYFDPTHRNPLPSPMVSFMAESRGFCRVKVLNLHPMPQFDRPEWGEGDLARNVRQFLFGPQDYALIGFKP